MDKLKYFEDKDPWMLAEDIPECFFFFAQVWLSSFANDLEKSCGRNYKKVLSVFHGTNMKFYYGENDSREFEEKLVQKIIDQPQFGENINKYIYLYSDKLREFTNKLAYSNLPKIPSREVCDWIEEHDKIHTQLYEWGWLSNATDMFHNTFTNRLINYLFDLTKNRLKANQYLSILSSPQTISVLNDQQVELLEIIDQIQQNNPAIHKISRENLTPGQIQLIKEYWQKYHHIKFLWIGSSGAYKLDDYFNQINEFLKTGLQARNEINRINREVKENVARKKELIKKISLNIIIVND